MTDLYDDDPDDFQRGLYGSDMVNWQPKPAGCCTDAQVCLDEGDEIILHTLGCENRCGVETPIAVPSVRDAYPCALGAGHDGGHWIPDGYVRATASGF